MFSIRPMRHDDLAAVLAIQAEAYGSDTLEAEAIIRTRFHTSPDTAWVAESGGNVYAYLVGYRSQLGEVTPLGGAFLPCANADSLYLHDLAVAARALGHGLGPALVNTALSLALREGLNWSSLVSVQGSRNFWERLGYRPGPELRPDQSINLGTYPGPAFYMVRALP